MKAIAILTKAFLQTFTISACGLVCTAVLLAQNISSSVSGTVVDNSGAPIAGAACELKNTANGVSLNAQSDTSGGCTFPTVYAGTYSLMVRATGFNALELKNIIVTS